MLISKGGRGAEVWSIRDDRIDFGSMRPVTAMVSALLTVKTCSVSTRACVRPLQHPVVSYPTTMGQQIAKRVSHTSRETLVWVKEKTRRTNCRHVSTSNLRTNCRISALPEEAFIQCSRNIVSRAQVANACYQLPAWTIRSPAHRACDVQSCVNTCVLR